MRSILYCLLLASFQGSAQIVVRINDNPPVTIAPANLVSLPRHTAVLNDHGKQVSYEGPLLRDLLTRAGVNFGEGLRGKQLSTYVAALGRLWLPLRPSRQQSEKAALLPQSEDP